MSRLGDGEERQEKSGSKGDLGLKLIATGKLIKVATLIAVGIAAIAVVGHDPPAAFVHAGSMCGIDAGSRHLHLLASKLSGVTTTQLREIGLVCFVYAAVFTVEGIGLWKKKKWAEYLTVIVTLSFIPIEIHEIARHASAPKIAMLVLNVAVLGYLVVRIMSGRRRAAHGQLGIASR